MTHDKGPTKEPRLSPQVRAEIVAMAQCAAAAISPENPKRADIIRAIGRMCARWKVGLPKGWDIAGTPDAVASLRGASAQTIKKVTPKA